MHRSDVRRPRRTASGWDVAVAVLAFVGSSFVGFFLGLTYGPGRTPVLLGVAVLVVMCVALVWRRTRPELSAAIVLLGAFLHFLLGLDLPVLLADSVVLVALYSVTAHGSLLAHRLAMAAAVVGAVLVATRVAGDGLTAVLALFLAVAGTSAGAWGIGLLRRTGILEERRREDDRLADLERRELAARNAVATERTRIAREMHDVVAHTLSVVIAQADGGRYAAAQDPAAAERALTTIAEMGRGALADIRRILGILRDDADTGAALVPQPVDEDLDRLVEQVRDAGRKVSVVRMGEARPLPAGAGLMLYRIAQEALTNVLRHAGPSASVTVLLRWDDARLELLVDDDGRGAGARSDGRGQGHIGMRERAAVFGGTVQAGPRPGGGFRVRVTLPVGAPGTPSDDTTTERTPA